MVDILDAAYNVLSAERRPMRTEGLTKRIVDGGLWGSETKTSVVSVGAAL